jgi:predicted  nucleic acid-binding Zn-ribbon protein
MDKKEEYRERMQAQLKEWKVKIDSLEARTSKISSETKADLLKEIEELRKKKVVVKEKWNELQKSSGEAWETMKEKVEKAAADLKQALDNVISRFK